MSNDFLHEAQNYFKKLVSKSIPLPIAFNAWLLKNNKRSAFMIEQRELITGSVTGVSKAITKYNKQFNAFVYDLSDGYERFQKALIWRKNDKKATNLIAIIKKK